MSQYNVLVDFQVVVQDGRIAHLFEGSSIHVEGIGPDQYQVGLGIEAPKDNNLEAYRRGVNLVKAHLEAAGLGEPDWIDGTVYDE